MKPLWRLRQMTVRHRIARPFYRVAEVLLGCYLPANARFAGEPCFPHGMHGVFVSGGARIGIDCVIFHHVTIGANTLLDSKGFGAPTLGDRVYVGAGAKLIGRIVIGDDVRIGAGAVVTRDVPSNATVLAGGTLIPSAMPKDNRFFRFGQSGWEFFRGGQWHRSDEPLQRAAAHDHVTP